MRLQQEIVQPAPPFGRRIADRRKAQRRFIRSGVALGAWGFVAGACGRFLPYSFPLLLVAVTVAALLGGFAVYNLIKSLDI